jgi:hypothetical protein
VTYRSEGFHSTFSIPQIRAKCKKRKNVFQIHPVQLDGIARFGFSRRRCCLTSGSVHRVAGSPPRPQTPSKVLVWPDLGRPARNEWSRALRVYSYIRFHPIWSPKNNTFPSRGLAPHSALFGITNRCRCSAATGKYTCPSNDAKVFSYSSLSARPPRRR